MTTSLLATSPGVFLAFHQYDQHAAEQARTYLKPWLPDAYLTSWDETSIAADDNWRERSSRAS